MKFLKELATLFLLVECIYSAAFKDRLELFEVRSRFVPYFWCDSENNLFKNNRIIARSFVAGDLDINQEPLKRCGAHGRGAPRSEIPDCPTGYYCAKATSRPTSAYNNGDCVLIAKSVSEDRIPR
jgi:hypothetical protein